MKYNTQHLNQTFRNMTKVGQILIMDYFVCTKVGQDVDETVGNNAPF